MPTAAVAPTSMVNSSGVTASPTSSSSLAQVSSGASYLAGKGFKASSPTNPNSSTTPNTKTSSPTVLSDTNIRESVIPNIISTASQFTPAPTNTNQNNPDTNNKNTGYNAASPTGNATEDTGTNYSDLYNKVFGEEIAQPQDHTTAQDLATLDSFKQTTDEGFKTQIANITSQYNQLQALQQAANENAQSKEENFLLKSGAYRTTTGPNASLAFTTMGINNLGMLQAKENSAIAAVQTAMNASDYKTAQSKITELDKVRTDKQNLAEKITQNLITQNQKINQAKVQSVKDNAIANLFTSGITDPTKILQKVDPSLGVTSKDIKSFLSTASGGNIAGLTGNTKNFYALKEAGALPSSIKSLPESEQLKAFLELEKTSTAKTTETKPLYTSAKGVAITKNDIADGVQKLDESKNGGKYADPKLYQAMYTQWEEAGLSPQDFIKNFPPKYYLDPTDTSLPSYISPGKTTSSISTPNFGGSSNSK